MIVNIDGIVMSTIYVVTNGEREVVVAGSLDIQRELGFTRDEADALLFGDCEINGFWLESFENYEMSNIGGFDD